MELQIILGILIVSFLVSAIVKTTQKKERAEFLSSRANDVDNWKKTVYLPIKKQLSIPENACMIKYRVADFSTNENHALVLRYSQIKSEFVKSYMWIKDDRIHIMPEWIDFSGEPVSVPFVLEKIFKHIQFSISDIEYFCRDGHIRHELKISGGGGGGSSLKGAAIGHMIASDVGAIIGSRKGNDPIISETITHDERKTIIKLKNGIYEFSHDAYDVFEKLIPYKEYEIVQELKKDNIIKNVRQEKDSSNVITDQIKKLSELMEDGILTKQEFQIKKNELLNKIS